MAALPRLRAGNRRESLSLAPDNSTGESHPPIRGLGQALLVIGLLIGFFAERDLFFPLRLRLEPKSDLAVTATIESGTQIEVFVNGQFDRTFSAHIQPGIATTYLFHDVPSEINFIRLDLTDSGNTHVVVNNISLISNGTVAGTISAEELKAWQTNQLKSPAFDAEAHSLSFVTEANDPFIYSGGLTLAAPQDGQPVSLSTRALNHIELIVAVLAAAVLVASMSGLRMFLPALGFLLLTIYPVRKLVAHCLQLKIGSPQIRQAVGNAGYHGYVKLPEQIGFAAGLLATICVGAAAGLAVSWLRRKRAVPDSVDEHRPFSLWKVLGVIAIFMVFHFPNLSTARVEFLHGQLADSGFDWANVFTWDYLYHYGFLPFRDYWFPYGGDYNQMGIAPVSLWWTYVVQCVLFSVLVVSLYELSDRRILLALAILVPVGIFIQLGILQGTKRYFAGLGAVLGLLALWKAKPRGVFPYALFGLYLGWIFAREPNQLIYAAPSLGLITLFFLLEPHHTRRFRRRVFQLLVVAGVFVLAVAANCGLLFVRGQLLGFFDFYAHMSAMGAAVSIPAALLDWYSLSAKYENLLILSMHVLAGLGAYFLLRRETRQFGLLLLGIALLESMIFFKMLLRPHMARQIIGLSLVGAALYLAHWKNLFRPAQLFAGAYLVGTAFGYFAHEGILRDLLAEYRNRADNFSSNLEALLEGTDLTREDLDSYYNLQRFSGLDADTVQLTEYVQQKQFPRFGGKFYVFGNESFLYSLLKEKPCPYITFYDGSSIWGQQTMLRCLGEQQPQLVAWNSANKIFDDVPNEVRVPVLFDYIISHYTPETAFGKFQVLRPRHAGEAFDWNFWRAQLGESVNVAALPRFSSFSKLKTCKEGAECLDFAEVSPGAVSPLVIRAGEKTFSVSFDPLTGDSAGHINLSRIWFWNEAVREGLSPTFEIAGKVDLERRRVKKGVLY